MMGTIHVTIAMRSPRLHLVAAVLFAVASLTCSGLAGITVKVTTSKPVYPYGDTIDVFVTVSNHTTAQIDYYDANGTNRYGTLLAMGMSNPLQPILDLASGELLGYEGLIRGHADSPLHSPANLFHVTRTFPFRAFAPFAFSRLDSLPGLDAC